MKKWEWIACCTIILIPVIALYEFHKKRKAKKTSSVLHDNAKGIKKRKLKIVDIDFFEKFTKNTINEARLKLDAEIVKELTALKTQTFDKIYELQKEPMREEDRDTIVKDFMQSRIKENKVLKDYLDDGLINADFIALHPKILLEKAKRLFRNVTVKGYLLYNTDITHPNFSIKPMAYKNKIYITTDTKELFLLDKSIGVYNGESIWYVVSGYPFSMEMEHCVEEIRQEFETIAQFDKRFVFKRQGLDSSDIQLKVKSIELQKELGYKPPTVERVAIALISCIMTAMVVSMFWMMHVSNLTGK
jgi:hypothetical protein